MVVSPRHWSASVLAMTLGSTLGPGNALATAQDGARCRLECGALLPEPGRSPLGVGTCLARCTARAAAPAATPSLPGPLTAAPATSLQRRAGAAYFAAAPSRGHGLAVGAADRAAAHRGAEAACFRSAAGTTCRPAGEFTARCGTVVHALRSNNAMVVTAHPSTHTVLATTFGSGPTREEAERQAVEACRRRGRGIICQIAESLCAD